MTNAEKYLKDGVVAKELWKTFQAYYYKNKSKESDVEKAFRNFFEEEAKPTLTDDERVILNHINVYEFDKIGRANNGDLYLHYREDKDTEDFWWYNHLFQFIKERRRI